jgi:tRNA A-37 threonylcarbamoyl transferase component Bud32
MSKPIDRDRPQRDADEADRTPPSGRPRPMPEELNHGHTEIDLARLSATPDSAASRVDTLPEEFARLIGRRTLGVGHVIGNNRFRLVERLGSGAMGEVFIAENLSIGMRVAVKLLKPELLADPLFRQRFQREAQAIAAIEHPNVARFLDLVVGDPTFLVMEYVRGVTLSNRLRDQKQLSVERAVDIGVRLCWALRAAHQVGVVHRDLKPANVILSTDAEHGEVPKLIDFGLAKLASQRGQEQSLTRTGQLIGTPQYMSPEQISGKAVDARSDIYALGCLLYELLTGTAPFTGTDDFQVLYQQVHEPAQPLRSRLPDAPAALEGVIACALAKDPAKRYSSMEEMATALTAAMPEPSEATDRAMERALRALPAGALSGLNRRGAAPPARGRRALWITGVAAVIAIGFGGGFATSRLGKRPGAPPASVGSLYVLSEPSGALVEVDGKPLAQTTPTMTADLSPGTHSVRIQRVGTAPVTQTVMVRAGERSAIEVTLPPATHRIEVRSVPDGASVLVDGHLVLGETPTTIDVTEDDFHELRVEKNGYETFTRALTPDDKEPTLTLTLLPEKNPRGTLMIDANTAVEVWLDGVNTGYTTPTLGIEVPVGTHTVEVHDGAGNKSQLTKVTVQRGQTVRLLLGATPPRPVKP